MGLCLAESATGADGQISITAAGRGLVWHDWEDAYIVYQPSSTETHVFNDTTAAALGLLQTANASFAELHTRLAHSLEINPDELHRGDLAFVVNRLEELGLIEWAG